MCISSNTLMKHYRGKKIYMPNFVLKGQSKLFSALTKNFVPMIMCSLGV